MVADVKRHKIRNQKTGSARDRSGRSAWLKGPALKASEYKWLCFLLALFSDFLRGERAAISGPAAPTQEIRKPKTAQSRLVEIAGLCAV